jgi:serine-type D-Ala-D-Ala carboxypeptidase (penicillin-binding protein 5/6)
VARRLGTLGPVAMRSLAALGICAAGLLMAASSAAAAAGAPPSLPVRAAALIEESTGQQLYGRNADARLAIASTTKLMTALVTLHHARLGQVFTDPNYYPASDDSQIGLVPGERMSVHDLLIAMMLPSADDAAEDLAFNVGHGSVARFEAMMNAQARELRLTHTHYTTPIGLDTPGNYSSAHDLVVLARYALRTEPFFKTVVSKPRARLRTGNHVRTVVNLNDLVGRYAWINGVKTGHTLDAGYVLVASGTREGMTLIGAVLGTPSEAARDSAALVLLDYGFATFGLRTPVRAGEVLARPLIKGEPRGRARLIAASTYTHAFPRSARVRVRVYAPAQLAGPLPAHAAMGSAVVVANGRVQVRIPLRLASAVPQIRSRKSLKRVVVLSATLSGVVLAVGAVVILRMFWRGWTRDNAPR